MQASSRLIGTLPRHSLPRSLETTHSCVWFRSCRGYREMKAAVDALNLTREVVSKSRGAARTKDRLMIHSRDHGYVPLFVHPSFCTQSPQVLGRLTRKHVEGRPTFPKTWNTWQLGTRRCSRPPRGPFSGALGVSTQYSLLVCCWIIGFRSVSCPMNDLCSRSSFLNFSIVMV
jgi:hypothetical protein